MLLPLVLGAVWPGERQPVGVGKWGSFYSAISYCRVLWLILVLGWALSLVGCLCWAQAGGRSAMHFVGFL